MIDLIVFLGNIGPKYQETRHNIAWKILEAMPHLRGLNRQKKFKGEYGTLKIQSKTVYVLKPYTYMNKSGESVSRLTDFYNIQPEQVLVIHDDLELPFGTISVKFNGGTAGHNGLKSIKTHLNSSDFYRLRFGIGRPGKLPVSAYVLQKFSSAEKPHLTDLVQAAAEAIDAIITDQNTVPFTQKLL